MNFTNGLDLRGALESALGSTKGRSQYELRIGPFTSNQLTVVSFEGQEGLNRPFVYDVVFSSNVPEDALQAGVFGFPACLSIHAPKPHEPRVIQGLAVGIEAIGASDAELSSGIRRFMVRIVPRLWLAKYQRRSRVFQEKSAVQIAKTVLEANGIKADVQLGREDYPVVAFEYQRNETDLEFLGRVLATAGIFYYFRHANGLFDDVLPGAGAVAGLAGAVGGVLGGAAAGVSGFVSDAESALGMTTTLVLTDKADSTEALGDTSLNVAASINPLAGGFGAAASAVGGSLAGAAGLTMSGSDRLVFDGNGQAAPSETERVYAFRLLKEVRPRQVNLRSWNLREAAAVTATDTSKAVDSTVSLNLSAGFDLSGNAGFGMGVTGDFTADALPIAPREVSMFEYQRDLGLQGIERKDAFGAAERALLQERSDWMTAQGETDCRRLAPGYRFTLAGHPVPRINVEYLVTETRSRGFSPDHLPEPEANDYRDYFTCVPSSVDPKPKKPALPTRYAPEPAVVVGPTYGDIHCDALGRILVRFRWAGVNGSAEGDEGVCWVHWLERWGGDGYGTQTLPRAGSEVIIDFLDGGEPIGVGQIHSRANVPAYSLPREATKVGIRTRTIPNGAESEISIDDNPHSERVLVHASGNFDTEVVRNTSADLGGTYDLTIAEERRESTHGDATLKFAKDVVVGVVGNLREEVAKDRVEIVLGSVHEYVDGNVSRTVGGQSEAVTYGTHKGTFFADSVVRHHGHHAVVVAASDSAVPASGVVHVEGAARVYAKGKIEVESPEGLTFICGESQITVRKDSVTIASPTITLMGKAVQLTASDTLGATGKTATLTGSDSVTVSGANKVTVAGQSASVVLDSNATVQGTKVKLGSGGADPASSRPPSKPKKVSTITLSDPNGKPIPNQRVILRKGGEGGEERVAVLDEKGQLAVEGDEAFEVLFADGLDAKSYQSYRR